MPGDGEGQLPGEGDPALYHAVEGVRGLTGGERAHHADKAVVAAAFDLVAVVDALEQDRARRLVRPGVGGEDEVDLVLEAVGLPAEPFPDLCGVAQGAPDPFEGRGNDRLDEEVILQGRICHWTAPC